MSYLRVADIAIAKYCNLHKNVLNNKYIHIHCGGLSIVQPKIRDLLLRLAWHTGPDYVTAKSPH